MSTERSKYRHICRVKKKEYNRNEASKLVTLSKSNSKQFWSIFNNKKSKSNLPDINFHEHLSHLLRIKQV